MKLILFFGTRPEAIKMAPIIHELQMQKIDFKVCVTGQHREMLQQTLNFFNIRPEFNLDLMKKNQRLNDLGSNILRKVDSILENEKPDLVLVHGDTTTAAFTSLAAFHREIKIGHVEAGLRTYNKTSPFPEEINRQLISRMATFHFSPTISAKQNLLKENIEEEGILVTGNTVVDALEFGKRKIEELSNHEISNLTGIPLESLNKFILVTGHRRESFGEGIENLCEAMLEIVKIEKIDFVYPVHLNPNVRDTVYKKLGDINNIHLINPVSYPVMLYLMKNCEFIISDSGGIQEEAPAFNKKILVTRDFSERMEGVEAGFSILVGTQRDKIIREASRLLKDSRRSQKLKNPYGDGKAAIRIVRSINDNFGDNQR
ncbi:UDP-N-acetylglucosamine 2-epimerase (non-hydrolyzing) [Gramella sp. GC03-9]|uniref:UDP-N-acetylglucosamine 2-epimerase (non-hydrolyzing) n=1 Tax=Christiangramia oceanisediminis TaxID=2920386 RepID=A0A9X2KUM6_9FLAO|nr:UDP-N-acetylglucosamine 2-epimerase (non-hydrolyzing) [Gramella oceanisediminis]MCP9198312.1 UDP-N-acetylglucosamine 2-epimerase (non-hydrolyzing) [Gramella oceanisediminis]